MEAAKRAIGDGIVLLEAEVKTVRGSRPITLTTRNCRDPAADQTMPPRGRVKWRWRNFILYFCFRYMNIYFVYIYMYIICRYYMYIPSGYGP